MKNIFSLVVLILCCGIVCLTPNGLFGQTSSNMSLLGNFGRGEGTTRSVAAVGSTVYYGIGTKFQIASFSTPASPQKVGALELNETIRDVGIVTIASVRYAAVMAGTKLFMINVQNPTAPTLSSNTDIGTTGQALVIGGTYAFMAAGSQGLKIYSVANPASPISVSGMDTLAYAEGVAYSAPYVYVAAGERTHIINATNPAAPTYVARIAALPGGYHQGVGVRGQYAYIADYEQGIYTINISNPLSPVPQGLLPTGLGSSRMTFDGNYGYISHRDTGLVIINVTNGASPIIAGKYNTTGQSSAVAFGSAGAPLAGYAFVADGAGGMVGINVSNPAAPTQTGAIPVSQAATGSAFAVTYQNNTAYVAYGTAGVRIVDVSTPTNPTLLGSFDTPGETRNVQVVGTTAYAADRGGGVRILNITNPAAITETGFIILRNPRNIVISGNYGYVADFDSGMTVINISNPAAPTKVASYLTPSFNAENITGQGNYVYLANGHVSEDQAQFKIFNISVPGAPVLISTTSLPTGYTEGVAPVGNFLYMAHGDSLKIYDITDPASPVLRSSLSTPGYKRHFAVSGNFAYGAAGGSGVRAINVSNPSAPVEAGFYDGIPAVRGVAASGNYIYSAEQADGLSIYQNTITAVGEEDGRIPRSISLYQNYPNPFNPSSTIQFEIQKQSRVRLEVQDLLGQTVAVILDEVRSAGFHTVRFEGRSLSSGVYLYRLTADGQQLSKKMMLLR